MAEKASSEQVFDTLTRVRRELTQLHWLGKQIAERYLMQNGDYYGNFFDFEHASVTWKAGSKHFIVESKRDGSRLEHDLDAPIRLQAAA